MIVVVWLAQTALGRTGEGIFESTLIAPELYMASVSLLLLALAAAASTFIGWRVYRTTQSVLAGISCQITAVLFVFLSPYIVYPTPKALLLSISVCLMAVLAPATLGGEGGGRYVNHQDCDLPRIASHNFVTGCLTSSVTGGGLNLVGFEGLL